MRRGHEQVRHGEKRQQQPLSAADLESTRGARHSGKPSHCDSSLRDKMLFGMRT